MVAYFPDWSATVPFIHLLILAALPFTSEHLSASPPPPQPLFSNKCLGNTGWKMRYILEFSVLIELQQTTYRSLFDNSVFWKEKCKPFRKNKFTKATFKGGGYLPTFPKLQHVRIWESTATSRTVRVFAPAHPWHGRAGLFGSLRNLFHVGLDPAQKWGLNKKMREISFLFFWLFLHIFV